MNIKQFAFARKLTLSIGMSILLCLPAISAICQSERNRQVSPPQKTSEGQTKPAQRPAPTPKTVQTPTKTQQPPTQEQGETIKITSNLVAVPVSVTDTSGQPVRNLIAQDFQLDEEGKSQQVVTLGEPGKTPVELALLFDISVSVHERFQFEQQAATRFLKEVLKPKDAASIFTIGFKPELVQPRIASVDKAISAALAVRPARAATAFFDTVVEAAHYLRKTAEPSARRVVVVISDGEDTLSENYKLGDALRELQRSDCLFYSINPSGPSIRLNKISLRGHEGMTTLATATGGAAFLPASLEDLDKVFRQITAELQAQYLLGYYSSDEQANGQFRRISVRVAKRPDLRVRARQGYYAPKA